MFAIPGDVPRNTMLPPSRATMARPYLESQMPVMAVSILMPVRLSMRPRGTTPQPLASRQRKMLAKEWLCGMKTTLRSHSKARGT
jgi:hypothetical protein